MTTEQQFFDSSKLWCLTTATTLLSTTKETKLRKSSEASRTSPIFKGAHPLLYCVTEKKIPQRLEIRYIYIYEQSLWKNKQILWRYKQTHRFLSYFDCDHRLYIINIHIVITYINTQQMTDFAKIITRQTTMTRQGLSQ